MGIKYLTVYAFSTENWKRRKDEVDALMTAAPQLYEDLPQDGEEESYEGPRHR